MKTGMMGRMLRPAMAFAAALGTGLAVAAAPAVAKKAEAKPSMILTEDSGGFISTRIGVPVEIRLKAQPGTGFSWSPGGTGAGVLTELKPVQSSKPMPGAAQTQRFRFLSNRAGTYRLNFSYDQPWRGGTKGARIKNFLIVVRN
jgi:hypothetical protein